MMIKRFLSAITLLCLVVFTFAGPVPKEFEDVAPEIRKTCQDETGAASDLIEKAAGGVFTDDDPKLKCYFKCTLQQFGLISRKQGIKWDSLVRVAPPSLKDTAIGISQKCKTIKGKDGDLCDLAYNNVKCAYENYPDVFFVL